MLRFSPAALRLPAELVTVIRARALSTSAMQLAPVKHTYVTTPIFYVNAG